MVERGVGGGGVCRSIWRVSVCVSLCMWGAGGEGCTWAESSPCSRAMQSAVPADSSEPRASLVSANKGAT